MQSTDNHKRTINVMDTACPSRLTLEILSDKWVILVIIAIARGYRRNGELIRLIGGISQKMLTQTLRKLEQGGIVQRTVFNQVPPHVEYDLTPLGTSLLEPIDALRAWAETHYAEVTTLPATF